MGILVESAAANPQQDPAAPAALAEQARLVGLRGTVLPTLEDVERRRLQLWLVSVALLLGLSVALLLSSLAPDAIEGWASTGLLRGGLLVLTLGFGAYTVEKELHLRRLTRLLVDERVLTAALSNRLQELGALLEAGKAINSVLELPAVLDIILGGATQLLGAEGGSIMLIEANGKALRVACVLGNDEARGALVAVDDGISGRVASSREALLINGRIGGRRRPVESAMSVPLLHRQELLGVLNVNAGADRRFTEYDLRAIGLFAEHAAAAIANARLYEAEREHVAELEALERHKSDFLAAVSHDLRTPLTSLVGCARMLHRPGLSEAHRTELAEMIDRQAGRLTAMVEDLLTSARLDAGYGEPITGVDAAAVVGEVAAEFLIAGRPIAVEATPGPGSAGDGPLVTADVEGLRRVLGNLVGNAFSHGTPPVIVRVRPGDAPDGSGAGVLIEVIDHGAGVAPHDRERAFQRFQRLDATRPSAAGVGLGLSIVRKLVERWGGRAWLDDAPSGGTAARVWLRPWPHDRPPMAATAHATAPEGGTPTPA